MAHVLAFILGQCLIVDLIGLVDLGSSASSFPIWVHLGFLVLVEFVFVVCVEVTVCNNAILTIANTCS